MFGIKFNVPIQVICKYNSVKIQEWQENIPISVLAFAEAGYKTVHLAFPSFGSSAAKTLPIAEINT